MIPTHDPRRRRAAVAGLGMVLVAGLLGAAPTAAAREQRPVADGPEPTVPAIDWGSCGSEKLQGFRCATAEVPTDYDHPGGATTTIAMTKLPATDPERRIGSLFTNPGGPGGSGVQFVQSAGKHAYTPAVRARFDIIGFDPRGVAGSDPATCYANAKEEAQATKGIPAFPFTRKQERRFTRRMVGLGRDCAAQSGERIAHASTANVARDMNLLSRALGDDELNYVGYSYGTYLGATYARLFPDRVRALVLDGTIDAAAYSGSDGNRNSMGTRMGQGPGAADTFGEFLRLCREAGPRRCALAKVGNPRTVMARTFRRLGTDPVPIEFPDGSRFLVTYPAAVDIAFQGMYDPSGWTGLAETFAQVARASDKGRLRSSGSAAETLDRLRGKDYPSLGGSLASVCVDATFPLRTRDYPTVADRQDAMARHFGRYRSWVGVQCEGIGVNDTDAYAGPWRQRVDEPVLVIGTRHDPATPYRNTRPYTRSFPDGRMLTVEGWGHTTIGRSDCADRRIARYLVHRKAVHGAVCRPDAMPFTKASGGRVARFPVGVPGPVL